MSTQKWIQKAIKHPGALTKKAKKAHMSVKQYANKVTKPGSKVSTQTKRQANLAKTLSKFSKRGK
jgi:aconitase A